MSVLIYAEAQQGKIRKASIEAVSYGSKIASASGKTVHVVLLGTAAADEISRLAAFGASNIHHVAGSGDVFDSSAAAHVMLKAAADTQASVLVFTHDYAGRSLAPVVAAKLNAALVSGVTSLPEMNGNAWVLSKNVFSGKASVKYKIESEVKVVSLMPNALAPEAQAAAGHVVDYSVALAGFVSKIKGTRKAIEHKGGVPLTEADFVVSAGRGMKGPENWHVIEDLAASLGAATACSRPVADIGWRPHHEHVGQTGIAIRPNLYIAVGISGAIQHLAGVNQSKVIVVINKDSDAPFFKAADYGVVGDAMEVVPRLTEAIKKFKAQQH
jgi:electron transfer flavoprotein alpha subunit